MRIIIVTPSLEVNQSVSSHTCHIASALTNRGHKVEVQNVNSGASGSDSDCFKGNDIEDYINAADYINKSADLCIVQYHSDAYGGNDGRYILSLVYKLKLPLITICQSVNNNPTNSERFVVNALSGKSESLITLSQIGLDFLEHFYKINQDQLFRLEHGVPSRQSKTVNSAISDLELESKRVILSVGCLSPEKGYETVINALPTLLNHHPDMVYLIQGVTDNIEYQKNGDQYRKSLMMLAKRRGVSDKVYFDDRTLSDLNIFQTIKESELYIAPDFNEKSLANAYLPMAVGAGALVFSTPTWFAKELLDDQRGQFFPFKSSKDLAQMIINTLRSSSEVSVYKETAALYGSQFVWENIGKRFDKLVKECVKSKAKLKVRAKTVIAPEILPKWNNEHLSKMSDSIGLFSSSLYSVIDFNKGYRLKDNAMAIQLFALASEYVDHSSIKEYLRTCLSFIAYLENSNGTWSSGMTLDKSKLNESCEYSEGRAIWALGSLYKRAKSEGTKDVAYSLLHRILFRNKDWADVKAKASIIIGASQVLEGGNPDPELFDIVKRFANALLKLIPEDIGIKWQWHEEQLTNNYGLVPLALAHAHKITGDNRYLSAARRSCRFIEKLLMSEGLFNPAISGHDKQSNKLIKSGDQSCNEAFLMVACYAKLYQISKEPLYLSQLSKVHLWYLGENNLLKSLYDHGEGGCYEGLSFRGVNPEKGTESTCSYWLSHFTYLEAYFMEIENIAKVE